MIVWFSLLCNVLDIIADVFVSIPFPPAAPTFSITISSLCPTNDFTFAFTVTMLFSPFFNIITSFALISSK